MSRPLPHPRTTLLILALLAWGGFLLGVGLMSRWLTPLAESTPVPADAPVVDSAPASSLPQDPAIGQAQNDATISPRPSPPAAHAPTTTPSAVAALDIAKTNEAPPSAAAPAAAELPPADDTHSLRSDGKTLRTSTSPNASSNATAEAQPSRRAATTNEPAPPPRRDRSRPDHETKTNSTTKPRDPGRRSEPTEANHNAWFVQIGAFTTPQAATQARTRLPRLNFPVRETPITLENGQVLHRVRVGPIPRREQALAIQRQLREAGFEATIVR